MAYRSGVGSTSTTTSVQVSTSALSITDGDIIIACCFSYRSASNAPGDPTIANQSGGAAWSSVTTRAISSYYKYAYAYKTANSESGNTYYTWSSTSATQMHGNLFVFSGRANQAPTPISNTAYITSDTNIRAAGITAAANDDLLWWGGWVLPGAGTITLPASTTSCFTTKTTAAAATRGGYQNAHAGGATGDYDGTIGSNSTTKHAFMFALQMAPVATSFDPMGLMGFYGM